MTARIVRYMALFGSMLFGLVFFLTRNFPYWALIPYIVATVVFFMTVVPAAKTIRYLHRHTSDLIIAAGFTFSALIIYLYRVTEITPGAWGDEITLGNMAQYLRKMGSFTPFVTHNMGHPTPLIYLSLLFITIMGRSLVSLRIVSVLFGALNAGLFYLFARRFFNKSYSALAAVLIVTSYVHIAVSRFAYEMSAAVFFFIAALLLLDLIRQRVTAGRIALYGLTLGLGIYTYLAFRTVAVIFIGAGLFFIWKKSSTKPKHMILFVISLLVILLPLFVYGYYHPSDLNVRVKALSVFDQGLPAHEVANELQGATYRTLTMFFFTGDPNPRQNPAGTTPFDILTSLLFLSGLAWLLVKKKAWFVILFSLSVTILATEIVTLERIPEFHYYGLGHPNTLRITLLVPLVAFGAIISLRYSIEKFIQGEGKMWVAAIIVAVIALINLNRYFGQQENQWIYATNFVVPLKIVNYLNDTQPPEAYLSPEYYNNVHINYFIHPSIHLKLAAVPSDCSLEKLPRGLVFIAGADLKSCPRDKINAFIQNPLPGFSFLASPWKTLDTIVRKD